MSERPIQVGDLVVVVAAPPCGCDESIGRVYRVGALVMDTSHCSVCGLVMLRGLLVEDADYPRFGAYPWRVRRIPPLDELESKRTEEELHA